METDIAHDRTDDGILFEPAFGLQFHGAEEHDLVAIHFLALFIDSQAAVGIAVVGNPYVGPILENRSL